MSDLVEFLTARLDEDELRAPGVSAKFMTVTREVIGVIDPARLLAEVEAKRRIVELHAECGTGVGYCDDGGHGNPGGGCGTLDLLASVYADHPDYRQEWKL